MFADGIAEGIRGMFAVAPMCVLAARKRFWRATEGTIIGVDIQTVRGPDRIQVPNYMLLYEYQVEGVQYFGIDRIPVEVSYHLVSTTVKDLCGQFPRGEQIEIYFSAANPAESSARRGVVGLGKALMMLAVGVIAAIGFYFYITGIALSRG